MSETWDRALRTVAGALQAERKAKKATPAQIRFVEAVADGHAAPMNVVGDWRPIKTAMERGWVKQVRADDYGRVRYEMLPAGYATIGRPVPMPTGPCAVCGAPDSASMGGEFECTRCASMVTDEMKAAREAGSMISVSEARQRTMRALAQERAVESVSAVKYPEGTPEHAAYAAALRSELARWVAGDTSGEPTPEFTAWQTMMREREALDAIEGCACISTEDVPERRREPGEFEVRSINNRNHIGRVGEAWALCRTAYGNGYVALPIAEVLVDCLGCMDEYRRCLA